MSLSSDGPEKCSGVGVVLAPNLHSGALVIVIALADANKTAKITCLIFF